MTIGKSHKKRFILAATLIIIGLGITALALLADYIGIGGPAGFGRNQIRLFLVGATILAGGIFLVTSFGFRIIQKLSGLVTFEDEPLQAYQHMVIALWFGFLTGISEAIVLAFRQNLLHQFINLSKEVYWMTILANLIIFAVIGLFIFMIAILTLDYIPLALTVFCSAFLSIMILMFLFERINQIAGLLLAIGVAIQVVRMVVRRSDQFYTFITRSFAWLFVFSALLVISMEVIL